MTRRLILGMFVALCFCLSFNTASAQEPAASSRADQLRRIPFFGLFIRPQQAEVDSQRRVPLPRSRRYLGGRYFGSFNNRFYGPQYGNF